MRENYISRFQRLFRHACVLIRTHMHNACVFDRRFLAIPFIFMLLSVLGRKGNICHSLHVRSQVLNESSCNYNFEPSAAAEATEGAESEPPKWRDPDRRKKREFNADIKKTAEGRLNDWLKRYDKFNLIVLRRRVLLTRWRFCRRPGWTTLTATSTSLPPASSTRALYTCTHSNYSIIYALVSLSGNKFYRSAF